MTKLLFLLAITACGLLAVRAHEESRIIGGRNATNGQFPHHVQVRNIEHKLEYPTCGGSIIGDRFVLTAAECFWLPPYEHRNNLSALRVIVGEVDYRADAVTHMVDKLIIHAESDFLKNNIAVVRVAQPFKFTANVRAIQLPTEDTPININGSVLPTIIAGWGFQKSVWDKSNDTSRYHPWMLQWLDTFAISHSECKRWLDEGTATILKDNHICAMSAKGAYPGACDYDQGGGLITHSAQPVIIGVLSHITNACLFAGPGIYVRVFPYLAFIRSAMEQ